MKTDVRNNFPGNSLTGGNQNKLNSCIFGSETENGEFSINNLNNNCIAEIPDEHVSNRCYHKDAVTIPDNNSANDAAIFEDSNIVPGTGSANGLQQGVRVKTVRRKVSQTESDFYGACMGDNVRENRQAVGNSCQPSRRRSSEFGILNPCFKEKEINLGTPKKSCSYDKASCTVCPPVHKFTFKSYSNFPAVNSRKVVLNDVINNALSGSDQLINLRELSNAISYNRELDTCNCQNLYDELMFPCLKPTPGNVIRNSCAKESHFVLGLPKKKPKFPNGTLPEIRVDNSFTLESNAKALIQNGTKGKYILPIPQNNEDGLNCSGLDNGSQEPDKDDNSDNFDKSEYLKFKQIACSRDDFKLKIFLDGISKKRRPPSLQNRSSSFPQTEEADPENNPDGSLRSPGRKYSHPAMSFYSVSEVAHKNGCRPASNSDVEEAVPVKPIPQYACNATNNDSFLENQQTTNLEECADLSTSPNTGKSASKRRLEFSLRRGSAPVIDNYVETDDRNYKYGHRDSTTAPQPLCQRAAQRRSTIGPTTMAADLRQMSDMDLIEEPFVAVPYSYRTKDASHLLQTRSKMFCDGFRSLDQIKSLSVSANSLDGLLSDSSSSDSSSFSSSSSDSSSCSSSSSWSISSSGASDSSE